MATASDAFTRADAANPGSNWVLAKGHTDHLGIFSNQVDIAGSPGDRCGNYWNPTTNTFGDAQFSQITIVAQAAHRQGPTVRSITTGTTRNYYLGGHQHSEDSSFLYAICKERANDSGVKLVTHGSQVVTAGDVVRLEITGDASPVLTLFVNSTQILQVTDSTNVLGSGQPGMRADHTTANVALFDDWSGGDLAAGAAPARLDYFPRGLERGVFHGG